MKSKKNCHYCELVKFDYGDIKDRNKLMDKKPCAQFYDTGLYVNGGELLTIKYGIGYFKVIQRTDIEFCPFCGVNLRGEVAE